VRQQTLSPLTDQVYKKSVEFLHFYVKMYNIPVLVKNVYVRLFMLIVMCKTSCLCVCACYVGRVGPNYIGRSFLILTVISESIRWKALVVSLDCLSSLNLGADMVESFPWSVGIFEESNPHS